MVNRQIRLKHSVQGALMGGHHIVKIYLENILLTASLPA
jgi:hypothetical protein